MADGHFEALQSDYVRTVSGVDLLVDGGIGKRRERHRSGVYLHNSSTAIGMCMTQDTLAVGTNRANGWDWLLQLDPSNLLGLTASSAMSCERISESALRTAHGQLAGSLVRISFIDPTSGW